MKQLLDNSDTLPSAPQAVLELSRTFDDDNARTADIVAAIESDPMLVVQLLRVANSPLFFRGNMIESTIDAVRLLGMSKVRALVIGILAKDAFPEVPENLLALFWQFSLNSAELSRHIAQLGRGDEDNCYLGGLLHMIGALAMRVLMPEKLVELDAKTHILDPERLKAETKAFGYNYAEVGAELMRRWKLPPKIVRIVDRQRSNNVGSAAEYDALVVQLASWRARSIFFATPYEDLLTTYPANFGKSLGVDMLDVLDWQPEGDTQID